LKAIFSIPKSFAAGPVPDPVAEVPEKSEPVTAAPSMDF
jgi:hypothetical protein